MNLFDQFSPVFHAFVRLERTWMEYRAEHNLYYPSDPRWKDLSHWREHIDARDNVGDRKNLLWSQLTDLEQYVMDPHLEESGYDWFRNEYELKILLRKSGGLLRHEWPDPWCHLIGHLCPSEEGPIRFVCMNCWKMYDRDPADSSSIVGEPDEKWLTDVLDRYAKTRGTSKPATARGVSGRPLQPEPAMEDIQEEAEVPDVPGGGKTGSKG